MTKAKITMEEIAAQLRKLHSFEYGTWYTDAADILDVHAGVIAEMREALQEVLTELEYYKLEAVGSSESLEKYRAILAKLQPKE